ncbi:MAG: Lrp/AsnC family transcriptional regulator [Acidimicrobiia bacterium]|nr:Lrp/AsnC family transcriptional regulator [Acidimicrobiia bacterium]
MTVHSAETPEASAIDALDGRIIRQLADEPRIGMLELSRRLGIARGTATARLEKLQRRGVITGFGPEIDLRALGFPVTAFVTIEVSQGQLATVTAPLRAVPEVIEAHVIAGQGDLLVRLAARSNDHLMEVLEHILSLPEIDRGATAIALAEQVPLRTMPLVEQAAGLGGGSAADQ